MTIETLTEMFHGCDLFFFATVTEALTHVATMHAETGRTGTVHTAEMGHGFTRVVAAMTARVGIMKFTRAGDAG